MAVVEASGAVSYFHTDRLGSVVAVSNGAGAASETYAYSPYGESANPVTGNPWRYTGRYLDAETGLYYYRARYYSPRLGQFLQTDPIGSKDDPNLYMYVGLDPGNKTDPSGMATCSRGTARYCTRIKKAEAAALANLQAAAGALRKAASGERLTRAEQAIVNRANRVFATGNLNATERSGVLSTAAAKIDTIAAHIADPNTIYVALPAGNGAEGIGGRGQIGLNLENFAGSSASSGVRLAKNAGLIQHEGAHSSGVAPSHRDLYVPGDGPYFGSGTNPGFYRDSVARFIASPSGRREFNALGEAEAYRCVSPGMSDCGF